MEFGESQSKLSPAASLSEVQQKTLEILNNIEGGQIERQLVDLAKINGTPAEPIVEQDERFATNRLALTAEDEEAKNTFIRPLMEDAGMKLDDHPFGLVGEYKGKNPDLAPLVLFSHIDTVQEGDMYDGTLGVLSAIKAVDAMQDAGFQPERNIIVISLTGEESARFNVALLGSKSMFQGLSDKELDSRRDKNNSSIRELLSEEDIDIVKQPIFGPGRKYQTPHAVIELHVEQDINLDKSGVDIGIVKAIAAPVRYMVEIGDEAIKPADSELSSSKYMRLEVAGKADHSGATPMDKDRRADGLMATAEYLLPVLSRMNDDSGMLVNLGQIGIEKQAMNKIPGHTVSFLRINGTSEQEIESLAQELVDRAEENNAEITDTRPHFGANPIKIEDAEEAEAGTFFDPEKILLRQMAALSLVESVEQIAGSYANHGVVATATTVETTSEGVLNVGLDIRGIEKQSRDEAIDKILGLTDSLGLFANISFGNSLPGSGDPVEMDKDLVGIVEEEIGKFEIGTTMIMPSAAGHDVQNAARIGAPSVMLFVPSLYEGAAHTPDAYTSTKSVGKGARALAAVAIKLSSRETLNSAL